VPRPAPGGGSKLPPKDACAAAVVFELGSLGEFKGAGAAGPTFLALDALMPPPFASRVGLLLVNLQ